LGTPNRRMAGRRPPLGRMGRCRKFYPYRWDLHDRVGQRRSVKQTGGPD
jgi:hypothetical protein